jgi:hypothetical protein
MVSKDEEIDTRRLYGSHNFEEPFNPREYDGSSSIDPRYHIPNL